MSYNFSLSVSGSLEEVPPREWIHSGSRQEAEKFSSSPNVPTAFFSTFLFTLQNTHLALEDWSQTQRFPSNEKWCMLSVYRFLHIMQCICLPCDEMKTFFKHVGTSFLLQYFFSNTSTSLLGYIQCNWKDTSSMMRWNNPLWRKATPDDCKQIFVYAPSRKNLPSAKNLSQ